MTRARFVLPLTILAVCNPAFAQHHQKQGGHPGGMGAHPGQVHPGQGQHHMMSPEDHMWHQWMQEQMMMNEMMGGPRMNRRQARPSAGASPSQAAPNRSQPSAGGRQSGSNQRQAGAKERHAGANKGQSVTNREQPNHLNEKSTKQSRDAAKKEQHHEDRHSQKRDPRKPATATKLPLAADQGTISLLRTVHSKLRGADHDYAGHRVKAMEHVAAAIRHLHPSAALNTSFASGAGNLPQSRSDQILRDALVHLDTTEASLGTGTDPRAHHRSARTSVAAAIRELHTALRIN
jgi:hypothetical protein